MTDYAKRTKKQQFFRVFLAALLMAALMTNLWSLSSVYADDEPDPNTVPVYSPYVAVYCTDTNSFLYDINANEKVYPASTTKILTAIVAIENGDLDQVIEVSENAVYGIDPSSSHIALDVGEKLTLRDALYGLLLASGNDCAVAIAEAVGGSVEEFSDMMNAKAKEIGCEDSHFTNPHGLFDEEHYTTVHDLCLLMAYAVTLDTFVEISSTVVHTIPKTNKQGKRELWNGHGMLKGKYAYYKPVICGKTGYITESGFNLVTYGAKNDIHLIVAIAGSDMQSQDCEDTRALMQFYFKNYELTTVDIPEDAAEEIVVDEKTTVPTSVEAQQIKLLLPKSKDPGEVTYETVPAEGLARPIEKGDQVGELTVKLGDDTLTTLPVIAEKTFQVPGHALKGILRNVMIALVIVIALILILLLIAQIRRAKQRRRRQFLHTSGRRRRR